MTEARVRKALQEAGGIVAHAARLLGVDRVTVWRWLKRYPELAQVREEARERLVDAAEDVIARAVEQGDVRAAMFVLDRLGWSRGWGRRQEMTLTIDTLRPRLIAMLEARGLPVEEYLPRLEARMRELLAASRGR
jgi:transposase-like protein